MMQLKENIEKRIRNNRGFTLIEVIAVLVILSIIGAVVISRGMSTAEVNVKAQTEVLKSHIRYAQFRAMNMKSEQSGCNSSFGISINTPNYFMFKDCDTDNKVVLPGASGDTVTLPNVTLSPSSAVITFDDWGRPYLDGAVTSSSISLSVSGEPINITQNTGFVQ